jgi:hypothetical protein
MGAYRNDDDLRQHRIENLERELVKARWELEKKDEEIADLQNKENARVNFYLEFGEDEERRLAEENRQLHQQIILLRDGPSQELSTALQRVTRANELSTALQTMRREVRRTRLLIMLLFVAYWLSMSGWLPL